MKGLQAIFDHLGMNSQNGLYLTAENIWQEKFPERIKRLLLDAKLKPEAFFALEHKPLVLFYDSPQNKKELFKAIWNFNESPVVIIIEPNTVEIFNGFLYDKKENTLKELTDKNNLNSFSYFQLVTGKTWQEYEVKFNYQNRVDFKLLENISEARKSLLAQCNNKSSLVNALIGKCIFVRYLIDRNVRLEFEGKLQKWTKENFSELLKNKNRTINFFKYLKDHFNGEAFLLDDFHLKEIPPEAFHVLSDLFSGTEMGTGQLSLFDVYDFSIIPVEFISNVYEDFIGKENQAKKGAYYTPLFLVDYIVKETVQKYFYVNEKEYNCKVLDPACGSGIFLVESLRLMVERYQKINKVNATKSQKFKDVLKTIAEENIYGIDEDENAINVAIFSIYLTLLDYQEPKEIENFRFPELLNKNFFTNDFFDLKADFNIKIKNNNFNFILGNPPWKRGSDKSAYFVKYLKERKKNELLGDSGNLLPEISNKEIAQAFVLRTSDFSSAQTKSALIITSKTLYNLNAVKFRKYLLTNYFIDKIFELAAVRREVFDKSKDKSIAPAAILFFHYAHGENTDKNIIEHIALKPNRFFSLFKVFILQRNDYKQVVQSRLMEFDWLWKTLVYGSYLDFNLIKRLKENYKTIGDIIINNTSFLVGQGIMIGGGDQNDISSFIGRDFIDTKSDIHPFYIKKILKKWKTKIVHRPRNIKLFEAPYLLITGGLSNNLQACTAIGYSDAIFKSSLTAIKTEKDNITILKILNGYFNSSLFAYYILLTGSSTGSEREEAHDSEKWSFPFIENLNISGKVSNIEENFKKYFEEYENILSATKVDFREKLDKLLVDLNKEILKSFDIDELESALVEYAVDINIPLTMRHNGYEKKILSALPFKDSFLEDYIHIFLTRFKTSFRNKHLKASVWHTNYILGIYFHVVPDNSIDTQLIEWQEKTEPEFLKKIYSLGSERITEKLFIQKDIRGFEKDGFYIIKPNEKKLWHKAIGYIDVNDFADAILKAGKEAYNG
jgi:hypothetical protein